MDYRGISKRSTKRFGSGALSIYSLYIYFVSCVVVVLNIPAAVFAGNSYIEFGQIDKVNRVSITAGALYVCSEDEKRSWEKRIAYQFLHFKLDQVVTDYFKLIYRVIAVRDLSLADRIRFVDSHRKVEKQIDNFQKAGYESIGKGKLTCEDVSAFAAEVLKFTD